MLFIPDHAEWYVVILFLEDYGFAILNKFWSYAAVDYNSHALIYTVGGHGLYYNNLIHVT